MELDEILGYHLEQAAQYKAELGHPDPLLAERAGARLAVAGRRALWRRDLRASAGLLERALTLTRPTRTRVTLELELDLASAYVATDPQQAASIAESAAERAQLAGDRAGEAAAHVVAADHRSWFANDPAPDAIEALARAALPLLEQDRDHAALVHVWRALANLANLRGSHQAEAEAEQKAIHHAGLNDQPLTNLFGLNGALVLGPVPADQALRTLDSLASDMSDPGPQLSRAVLLAMLGRFEEAWPIAQEGADRWRALINDDGENFPIAQMAVLSGDHESAARHLRTSVDRVEREGRRPELSTVAPLLGRSLCALGRYGEAEPLAQLGRELGDEQDRYTQMLWRQVQALIDAQRGGHTPAEQLAREACAIAEQTDALNAQGDALIDLAQVLQAGGRGDEAVATLKQALERYERKKNIAMAAQVRERLATPRSANAGAYRP